MSVDMTATLSKEAVVAISERKGEPDWMRDLRLQAFEFYAKADVPVWDRTDISHIAFEDIVPYGEVADASDVESLPASAQRIIQNADADGALLVQVDSTVVYRRVPASLEEQGVIFTSLDDAVQNHADLVKKHFMQQLAADTDKIVALHAAFHSGGAFVYVPKNVNVELPLEFVALSEKEKLGMFPHVLVIAEEGADITVVERYESGDEHRVVSQMVEVVAEANSNVTFGSVQTWGDATESFHARRAQVARDANVNWIVGEIGSRLGRAVTHSALVGDGSESTASVVFFGDQSQHLDTGIVMNHFGSYTSGDMLTKGVLKDTSRCIYRACTDIEDGARNTSGFQIENTLMLSKDARIDAIPELEIEETEVQAGHAATVGQIDEEQLFYMMTRGVPRDEAVRLIVHGFFDPLLSRIPLESIRDRLSELIDRKMDR